MVSAPLRWLMIAAIACALASTGGAFAQELSLKSKAAVLMDAHSGRVLYEMNAHEALPPASVTKVMTLTLALEAIRDGRATYGELVPVE